MSGFPFPDLAPTMTLPSDLSLCLTRSFYEGLAKPQRFAEGLRQMGEMLGSDFIVFGLWDRRGMWASWRQARRMDGNAWQYSMEDGPSSAIEFRSTVRKLSPGKWAGVRGLDLPNGIGRPAGEAVHALCRRLSVARAEGLVCLYRHDASSPGAALLREADDILDTLLPSLEPLARMHQLTQGNRHLSQLLSCIRMPVMLVDASLRMLAANPAARALVEQAQKNIGSKANIVLPGLSAEQFKTIVRRAFNPKDNGSGSLVQIRSGNAQLPMQVMVTPVAPNPALGGGQATALILVNGPGRNGDSSDSLLQHIFGLTPAEARLTRMILDGRSPGDAATMLQVSVSTVRTQLSAVLKKTGAQRQSDLVSRLSPLLVLDSGHHLH